MTPNSMAPPLSHVWSKAQIMFLTGDGLSLCQSVGAKEIYIDQKLLPKAWRDVWWGCRGRYSRPHKGRCYKIIKGMSWKSKLLGFFMLKFPPSALQLSSQSSSRGGSLWPCSRAPSFLLHPLDPPLPSLEAVWGHFPIWKITARDQPLNLFQDLRSEMEFFLAIKIFKQKLCWQKCVGLLALSAFGYILLHGMMQFLSIPTEAQFKKFPIFSDGWTCFFRRSQLILCVCCYYYLHSLRSKIQRIIIRRKNTIISGL